MPPIIRVENLGKRYRIGAKQEALATLRESLVRTARSPFKMLQRNEAEEMIWAVKDVSFEIEAGEAVGIIGRNGAGKSTLLKMLSRITEPTEGKIELYGRIGSLLEVGTGFHPELTGRENIYLNGAILGMARAEIVRKFDEIVAFAEVEKFIDTPVKHYSSGMYLRLAFAVAAHLEPEILLVDEVLAVGDARFQRKCLNKMQDAGQQGRTVLFVSHNMSAITRLCQRTIFLEEGSVVADGPSHQVVSRYLNSGMGTTARREWPDESKAPGNEVARLRAVCVRNEEGEITDAVDIRRDVYLEVEYEVLKDGHILIPNFGVYNEEGVMVFLTHDSDPAWRRKERPRGRYTSTARIPGNFLSEGTLVVGVAIGQHVPTAVLHVHYGEAVAFQVIDSMEGDTARGDYGGALPGIVRPLLDWQTRFESHEETDRLSVKEGASV
ncbi:MAG TPA: ABC transporter ATP-binding protein [Pyrinomonadaceae bacterium]